MSSVDPRIKKILQEISSRQFSKHCRDLKFRALELENAPLDAHAVERVSSILLWGPSGKLNFKVYFSFETAAHLISRLGTTDENTIDDEASVDFMREYTNLNAGYMRGLFEKVGLRLGMTIPFVMGTSSEDVCKIAGLTDGKGLVWRLAADDIDVICSIEFENIDETRLLSSIDRLQELLAQETLQTQAIGDVEFLN